MKKMTLLNNFNEYSIDKKAALHGGLLEGVNMRGQFSNQLLSDLKKIVNLQKVLSNKVK